MTDSWTDKLKNETNKVVLTGVMALQSVVGIGQKVPQEYQSEKQNSPEEQIAAAPQNASAGNINETAFAQTATPEDINSVQTVSNSDNSEEASKSHLQQKYGFDVVYEPENDKFMLKQDGLYDRGMFKDFLDYDSWAQGLQERRDKIYSHDTEITFKEVDLKEHLEKGRYIYIAKQMTDNTIEVFQYNVKPEDKAECLRLLQGKNYGLTPKEAEKTFDIMTTTDITAKLSQIEHEKAHSHDMKEAKLDQQDLPPYRMAQLEMLTEVHAYMEQAGLALDVFKANGDLQYFDKINLDMSNIKGELQKNPDMKNPEGFVASQLFNQFMKEHNHEGSTYSDQVLSLTNPSNISADYRVWSYVDNETSRQEYLKRVDAMFANVGGLGDVRQYINPDFELYPQMYDKLMDNGIVNKNFQAVMSANADNPKGYAQNLQDFLQKVKEVDADGIRTPEEVAQLDKYIQSKVSATKETAQKGTVATPQPKVENAQNNEQPASAQPLKKVADMTPKEKYDYINNNLRQGKNPNLNTEVKEAPVNTKQKMPEKTLSPQQIAQAMNRRNAGNGL